MTPAPDPAARSIAEGLFAEILLAQGEDVEPRLQALCERRPELAGELRELGRDWRFFRSLERRALPDLSATAALPAVNRTAREEPRIAGYACRAWIGSGGMGEVWEAHDLELDRTVALKVLPANLLDSDVGRERFRREALAAARVNHPSIVGVYSAGEQEGRPWISQELVAGGRTLFDRIAELKRAPELPPDHERTVAKLFVQAAEALEAAHRAGIVHRDLKPQNILLTAEGVPKVADFGLAWLEGQTALSRAGEFLGTWHYASPEHLLAGNQRSDARSDVFCLGVALYECLTLELPFDGQTSQEIAHAIQYEEPRAPRTRRARVPRELSVICMKALEKRAQDRYQTMQALAQDLRRFLADEPILARPPGRVDRARRWGRRHPVKATALALGSAALIGLSASQWRTLAALEGARQAQAGESRANAELLATIQELKDSRDEARSERAVSDEVVRFLSDLFLRAAPARLAPGDPTLRELVARGAEQLRSGDPASPPVRARLLTTLGQVLTTLGDWAAAEDFLAEARGLWSALGQEGAPEVLEGLVMLTHVRMNRGDVGGALELALPLVERWRAGSLPPELASSVLSDLGQLRNAAGQYGEARAALEESAALREELSGPRSLEAAFARGLLTQVDFRLGNFAEGLARVEADAELVQPLLEAGNAIALDGVNMRALFLQALGRPAEAEPLFVEALAVSERVLGADHPRSLTLRTNLGTVVQDLGRLDEAEDLFRESLELAAGSLGPGSTESLTARNDLAQCLMLANRLEEARVLLEELLAEARLSRGEQHLDTARARISLSYCLWQMGSPAQALQVAEPALAAIPQDAPFRAQAESFVAMYRLAAGRH